MGILTGLGRCGVWMCLLAAAGCANRKAETNVADFFPIMTWELPPRVGLMRDGHAGLGSMKECGFTVAGFVRPEDLGECRRLGLRAIVRPEKWKVDWRGMSDGQIEAHVRALVKGTEKDPTVLGYFLTDEPGVGEFAGLGKAVAWVKKLAPGKLAYINLFPNYATLGAPNLSQLGTGSYGEYLERYVKEVTPQVISYDNYQVQFSDDLSKAGVAGSYFQNLLAVRRVAMEHGLPFWNIVSSNQIRSTTPPPSAANMMLQGYTTLAAGGRGVTWFTYYPGGYGYAPIDRQGRRTGTWADLRMVNERLGTIGPIVAKLRSTGVYFSKAALTVGLPMLPGEIVERVESETPVMVGEFGEEYVMIVNLSLERSAKVRVKGNFNGAQVREVSPADGGMVRIEKDGSVWLTAGEGALLKVK